MIGKMLLGGLVLAVTALLVAGLHVALVIGYVWGWITVLAALLRGEPGFRAAPKTLSQTERKCFSPNCRCDFQPGSCRQRR